MGKALLGKVALITGGSTGIGAAVSERFAAEGAKVAVNAHEDYERASQFVEALQAAGNEATLVRADITSAPQVSSMIEAVRDTFGPIDILVNNAGIYPRCSWASMAEADWDSVVDVNLKGQFLCAHGCYEDMVKRRRGKIINVSSNSVLLGKRDLVHYIAAKAGVIGLTRALARELGEFGVCVNCVIPGAILVERELETYPDQEDVARRLSERQCIRRRGTPADMAGAFCFLASSDSDFITGQSITVDGGWAFC